MDQIFETVVLGQPTETEKKKGKRAVILQGITVVLAENEEEARTICIMELGKAAREYPTNRLEVQVRPF